MKVIAVPEACNGSNPKLIIADLIINSLTDFDVESVDGFFENL